MGTYQKLTATLASAFAGLALSGCVVVDLTDQDESPAMRMVAERSEHLFEQDRDAILAMQGEYAVVFDFRETVAIAPGYELATPKTTPAREVVIVIEDEGDFIILQHLLIAGPDDNPFIVKHWRQDWRYQPEQLLSFQGHDNWTMEYVSSVEGAGAWSQTVYQIDDSPRYAALAVWDHGDDASTWEPPVSWRPLPRRDDTTRTDYDAVAAVNRHTITPWGWTHEQDNSKIAIRDGEVFELVREVGLNTYTRSEIARADAAHEYWNETHEFWGQVRTYFLDLEASADAFHIEDDAEGTLLYGPVMSAAQRVLYGMSDADTAYAEVLVNMESQVSITE